MARPYLTGYTPKYPVQTLSKALDIIEYLKNNNTAEGVSISEISRELDMAEKRCAPPFGHIDGIRLC